MQKGQIERNSKRQSSEDESKKKRLKDRKLRIERQTCIERLKQHERGTDR